MATPFRGELRFDHPNARRDRYYPAAALTGTGVADAMGVFSSGPWAGRACLDLAVDSTGSSAAGSSTLFYSLSHRKTRQNGASLGNTSSTPTLKIRMKFQLSATEPAGMSTANRDRFFSLMVSSGVILCNFSIDKSGGGNLRLRSFFGSAVTEVVSAPYDGNTNVIEVHYRAASGAGNNGDYRVFWNNVEIAGMRRLNHNTSSSVGGFRIESDRSAGTSARLTKVFGLRWSDDLNDNILLGSDGEQNIDGFFDFPGSVQIRDRKHDSVKITVQLPPGALGFTNIFAAIRPLPGSTFTGTNYEELTATNGHTYTFTINSLAPFDEQGFVVEFASDAFGADAVTTIEYSFKTHQAPGQARTIDLFAPFCLQQDGYSQPHYAYDIIAGLINPNHDTLVTRHEDWVYLDNRDKTFVAGDHEFDSLVGVTREALTDFGCHHLLSRVGSMTGWGDHHFNNNFNPSWVGSSGTSGIGPYVSTTQGAIHSESRKLIERIEVPGYFNVLVADTQIRFSQLGRTIFIHMNNVEYWTSTSMLGAAQLAAILSLLADVRDGVYGDIETIVLMSPYVMSDVVWKATQDWEGQNNARGLAWRAERKVLFDAVEEACSRWFIVEGDSHIGYVSTRFRTHYNDPISGDPLRWPKHMFSCCVGAGANNGLTSLTTIIDVADSPPSGAGTLAAAAAKDGVLWLSNQAEPPDNYDAFQQPASGSPGYTRMFASIRIVQNGGPVTLTAHDASYLDAPADRVLFTDSFRFSVGANPRSRGWVLSRTRAYRSR